MEVVMGRAKELVVKREEEVLAGSAGGARGRPGEAFPFQVFSTILLVTCVVRLVCCCGGGVVLWRRGRLESTQRSVRVVLFARMSPPFARGWCLGPLRRSGSKGVVRWNNFGGNSV